jgi:hypothetical protein
MKNSNSTEVWLNVADYKSVTQKGMKEITYIIVTYFILLQILA